MVGRFENETQSAGGIQGGTINCRVVISLTILEGKLNLVKIYEI